MEVKRTKTPEQALRALMNVCAKSERAISDVRRSLTRWGVAPEESLRRKMQGIRTASDYQMRGKLLRYGAGLGFDYDEVSDAIDRLMREREK